ncbi:MAG: septum formation initiator family protein [Defluviitaleaceae bacterium]|nr:septum formation initiator family protein [Defluviitaleaceae bacterium]
MSASSNSARKLQPQPLPPPNSRPHPRRRNPQKKQNAKKSQNRQRKSKPRASKYVYFDSMNNRISFPITFTVFLIFALGVGTAFSSAYLQDMRNQIERQRTALHQKQDENAAMRASVARNLQLYDVERIARERLHMALPDESQIVFIDVSRQSYVVQSDEPSQTRSQGMWQSALRYIRNWLGV